MCRRCAQQSESPFVSVIVTLVLLKLALMWAIPTVTLRRALRRLLFAIFRGQGSGDQGSGWGYFKSFTPFFPATVFLGPLRVRALVRVRWPRTGSPGDGECSGNN